MMGSVFRCEPGPHSDNGRTAGRRVARRRVAGRPLADGLVAGLLVLAAGGCTGGHPATLGSPHSAHSGSPSSASTSAPSASGATSPPAPPASTQPTSTQPTSTQPTSTQPTSTQPGSTVPATAEWLTYHHDAGRSGNAPGEPPVSAVSRLWRTALDGQVYAEPLMSGGRVIAATEHNTVYALDAPTGKIVWSTNLGPPMPGSALPCGNVDPSGITGTPVIDAAHQLVWVVAFIRPGRHELVGLSLTDGQVTSRRTLRLPGVDELAEQQRGALTLLDKTVYVPFGGLFGDCGNYRGFVVGLSTSGADAQSTFAVPTAREGAIWAPPGPVVDRAGDLLVATGNGASTSHYDQGDSVIALTPQLREAGTFAPTDWVRLNESDLDLGSVSPTVVGDAVFQIGKAGVGYLLDPRDLGGIGGQRSTTRVCQGGSFGATAVDGATVLVPCRSGLVALQIGPGWTSHQLWSQPAVTSGAPVIAAGHVWVVTRAGSLVVLDEHTGVVRTKEQVGSGNTSFPSLAIAGGRAFVAAGAAIVAVGGV